MRTLGAPRDLARVLHGPAVHVPAALRPRVGVRDCGLDRRLAALEPHGGPRLRVPGGPLQPSADDRLPARVQVPEVHGLQAVPSKKDAKLAQKLGQLQPVIAVSSGPT